MSVSKTNNAWRYLRRSVFCLSSVWLMTALMSGLAEAQSGREQDASGQAPVSLTDLGRFNENTSVSPPTDETTPEAEDAASADNQTDTSSVSAAAEPAAREPVAAAPSAEASTGLQTNVTGRVGRRSISKIGLASIGLNQAHSADSVINSLIWSDSDAEQALALVTATPARGSSAALSALTTAITIQTAVPPKHAGPLAEQLVKARLDWLARSGQSDKLSQIVRLLPLDEEWSDWKRWQIEYDLVRRADQAACVDAERFASQTLEPFWHKARVICALLDGQQGAASFAADILRASGEQDENFFQLVDKLLGRSSSLSLDVDNLSLLHLILMDAAHEQISMAAFENLPASMIQAASSFRYLAPDAALNTSYQMLDRGLQSSGETEQVWRALLSAPVAAEAALASLESTPADGRSVLRQDGLDSAFLWVGLVNRQGDDTDMLIGRALQREAAAGRIDLLLDLYASLIRQRLDITEAATLSDELAGDYAVILALAAPSQPLPSVLESASAKADDIRALLSAGRAPHWDADLFARLDCWALVPVFEARGLTAPSRDWVAQLAAQTDRAQTSAVAPAYRLSPPGLLALEQAAEAGRIGEAALIAARLMQPVTLGWVAPQDSARVLTALQQVGLDEAATALADELIRSYLLRHHFILAES